MGFKGFDSRDARKLYGTCLVILFGSSLIAWLPFILQECLNEACRVVEKWNFPHHAARGSELRDSVQLKIWDRSAFSDGNGFPTLHSSEYQEKVKKCILNKVGSPRIDLLIYHK